MMINGCVYGVVFASALFALSCGGDANVKVDVGLDGGADVADDGGSDASRDGAGDTSNDSGSDSGGPVCGDNNIDIELGEQCDDGNTNDGDGCDKNCRFEALGGKCNDTVIDAPLEKCDPPEVMPADGDGCNATCNLSGAVTTLRTLRAAAMTSDNTHLYVAVRDCLADTCGIGKIDIAACNAAPNTAACDPVYISGGPGQCACPTGSCNTTFTPAPGVVDGAKDVATFADMGSMTTDGKTIWIAHQQTIREVDIASGAVQTVAGVRGSCAAIDDTTGVKGLLHSVRGLTYDNGLVYFLDGTEAVLRTFDPATRELSTIAGKRVPDCRVTQSDPYTCPAPCTFVPCVGGATTPSPGLGLAAEFVSPRYLTTDRANNLYIIDTNGEAIMRYNTVSTQVDVLVSGSAGSPSGGAYVDGTAANTTLGRPRGIISDGTSVYFAEQLYATVRQTELSGLNTTTFVGTHGCAAGTVSGDTTNPRDGLGANTTGSPFSQGTGPTLRCVDSPPSGTPIFNRLFGAMTYNYASRAIYMVDGDQLRRID